MNQGNPMYADFVEYVRLSDSLYPNRYRLQRTVILLRPSIIRLGLTDLIVSFFERKNFVVLHRSTASLTDYNASLLSRLEEISEDQIELYKESIQETHVETLLLTKYGAISEAYSLSYENDKELEREISKEGEFEFNEKKQRILIDPARSLNYILKGEIEKNREIINRLQLEPIPFQKPKQWQHRHIICQINEYSINQMICMFSHKFSQISDIIIMINPLYFEKRLELKALLNKRLRFKVINEVEVVIDEQMSKSYMREYCLKHKYENWRDIEDYFFQRKTMLLHTTKPGGFEELEIMYNRYAKDNEDELMKKRPELSPELKLQDIPHYFIPAFTLGARELAQELLNPNLISFTGDDLVKKGIGAERRQQIDRLNFMLETTVGGRMKTAIADANIDDGSQGSWIEKTFIQSNTIPYINEQGYKKKIICEDPEVSASVHIAVEAQNIGYYEIRVSRLKDEMGKIFIEIGTRLKRDYKIKALYYNNVSEKYPEYTPAFYQYRLYPRECTKGNSVDMAYECEEYMGRMFINDIAITMKKYREAEKTEHFQHLSPDERRGSIVAHLWGQKIGKMCAKLNTLEHNNVKGYGKLVEIKGGSKDNKKYACEFNCEPEEVSEVKLKNIVAMVDKIENYFKKSKEHLKFVKMMKEWLGKLWDDEDYVAMWKDPKVYLVPEKLNEFNIRIYAKITRIANVMKDIEDNPADNIEMRRFNPQFEKVIANFPTSPEMVNVRADPRADTSLFFSRYMENRSFIPASAVGATVYEYDFKKKIEFEDQRPNAVSFVEKSVYGDNIRTTDRFFKAAYLLVQKKNCSIVNPEILANRTRYYLTGMILWILSVRLKKLKRYDSAFDDKTDYIVCINNVMQGMATYFEKAQGEVFKRAHIQCEYIIYGIKTASELIDEINNIRRLLNNIKEGRTIRTDFDFGEPAIQSSRKLANEEKKAFERIAHERYDLEVKLKLKEDELDATLVEIAYPSIDKLLVYHENLIHIKRERYYQPAIFEYWEPDMKHERYMKKVTYGGDTMQLLPERLKEPKNVSEVQMRWAKTEVVEKTMLRPCPDNKLEDEVKIKKITTEADKKMRNAIDAIIKRIKEQ